ncbi:hypothetical protein QQS21_005687 [Conoideocrella luteorostrata]|uniref:JmjC domain-containing protein n=1 Tax=Conoideocrella luteorostrata TaxID=1105319 RepID=A0AAJ0CP04_9HYPO|nr:hypothetical protein QQS21_005687 [Conoideocrella luteorostrata]
MTLCSDSVDDSCIDEFTPFLDESKAVRAKRFRDKLHSCENDNKKYELCLSKRDELFNEQHYLQIEFACYEQIFAESQVYKDSRTQASWQNFTATAAEGSKNRNRIATELKKAASFWGEPLVQHYSVGERGINFAIQFAAAAKIHPEWEAQALPRFQQLVRRRIQLAEHGRHRFTYPLERIDLINIKLWTADGPYTKSKDPEEVMLPLERLDQDQLPESYGFDQFGLLAPEASALPCYGDGDASLSILRQSIETAGCTKENVSDSVDKTPEADGMKTPENTPPTDSSTDLEASARSIAAEDINGRAATTAATQGGGNNPSVMTAGLDGRPLRRSLRSRENDMCPPVVSKSALRRRSGTKGNLRTGVQEPAESVLMQRRSDVKQLKALVKKMLHLSPTVSRSVSASPGKRPRSVSLPPDKQSCRATKRHCISDLVLEPYSITGHNHLARPTCDWSVDEAFLAQALTELSQEANKASNSRGHHTAGVLLPILRNCKHPNTDRSDCAADLLLLDGHEAKALLDTKTPDVPIITERQQHFEWKDPYRPISEFFDWTVDYDQMVSVQIPSLDFNKCSFEPRSIQQVYKRFLTADESDDPWNILDLGCPLPSTVPDFLTGENCQLLAQIRNTILNRDSAERTVATREEWAEWRDIERWALMSEGGHCTAPHMDSHGLATWITVQEGLFGFKWLSQPSQQQRNKWMEDPEQYNENQNWRYWVLKPGQTIFFPPGTIHGVFRIRKSQTFALGGHILQWSSIAQWADVISAQLDFPDSTNEDMTDAWKWVHVVTHLLQKRAERVGAVSQVTIF